MTRLKLTLQYKGTNYCGWQVQPNGITIQEVLQRTLFKITRHKVKIIGSGRTDSGVHALAQVCHFDWPSPKGLPQSIKKDPHKLVLGLNSLLPDDIAVTDCQIAPNNFHAQTWAKKKQYNYFILNSLFRSPFLEDYAWRIPYPLNIEKMKKAAKLFIGEHDFKAFCAADSTAKTTVRRIYSITIGLKQHLPFLHTQDNERRVPSNEQRIIRISITGNGFLKHMVRNIAGTLVDVGRGRQTITKLKKVIKSRDRRKAGATAPAKGLVLAKVVY